MCLLPDLQFMRLWRNLKPLVLWQTKNKIVNVQFLLMSLLLILISDIKIMFYLNLLNYTKICLILFYLKANNLANFIWFLSCFYLFQFILNNIQNIKGKGIRITGDVDASIHIYTAMTLGGGRVASSTLGRLYLHSCPPSIHL